jgi:uncharacterized protein YlxW (UPF0749 family)
MRMKSAESVQGLVVFCNQIKGIFPGIVKAGAWLADIEEEHNGLHEVRAERVTLAGEISCLRDQEATLKQSVADLQAKVKPLGAEARAREGEIAAKEATLARLSADIAELKERHGLA